MFFERIYDTDLAQASYIIGCQSNGEAVVIDARRDTDVYHQIAATNGLKTDGVTEVFPPTFAIVRALASRPASPTEALRLRQGTEGTEARIDIGVEAGHRATDVALAVQQKIHAVLIRHGIKVAFVAVTVLEHGRAGTLPRT